MTIYPIAAHSTRPDIALAVSYLVRSLHDPRQSDWQAAK
jgi:hypothetical protein